MPATQLRPNSLTATAATNPELAARRADRGRPAHVPALSPADRSHQEARLDGLTSLRFFAASMILLLHISQLFGFYSHTPLDGVALWQGVSFFFVLSGFILAYVYPEIKSSRQSNRFLTARFARVWPTHFAAFALTILLVPSVLHIANVIPAAIANLCIVHVWALNPALGESFNSVSWTISVELFFYLCFPFLIQDFSKPFKARWIAVATLSAACIGLCMIPVSAGYGKSALPPSLFLGENPLCRLLEFTLGIATCRIFKKSRLLSSLNRSMATALEIVALIGIAAAINLSAIWPAASAPGALSVLRDWAVDMGGAPAYALLILIVATEKGHIAQLLKRKSLVHLGEISFSLYMLHLSILYALLKYQSSFGNMPDLVLPTVAVFLCLLAADLNFTLIETPCRKWILRTYKSWESATEANKSTNQSSALSLRLDELVFSSPVPVSIKSPSLITSGKLQRATQPQPGIFEDLLFAAPRPGARKQFAGTPGFFEDLLFVPPRPSASKRISGAPSFFKDLLFTPPRPSAQKSWHAGTKRNQFSFGLSASTVAEVLALLLVVSWVNTQFRFVAPWASQSIEAHSVPTAKGITFGGKFKLRGLKVSKREDGLHVMEVWQSVGEQKLKCLNAVQVIDPWGRTLTTKTYAQDIFNRSIKSGTIWEDQIHITPEEYKHGLRLGFSIFESRKALLADKGVTDGDKTRLLVAIPY
jgi:peptidoglycan/LPS O-acetylase OafA/YrhL